MRVLKKMLGLAGRAVARTKAAVAAVIGVAAGGLALVNDAAAQLTAIASGGGSHLVGVSTSGSETGIHELLTVQNAMIAVVVVMVVVSGLYRLFRRWYMRGSTAG